MLSVSCSHSSLVQSKSALSISYALVSIVLGCHRQRFRMDFVSCIILSCSLYVEDPFLMPVFDFLVDHKFATLIKLLRLPFSLMELVSMAVCVFFIGTQLSCKFKKAVHKEILALGMDVYTI